MIFQGDLISFQGFENISAFLRMTAVSDGHQNMYLNLKSICSIFTSISGKLSIPQRIQNSCSISYEYIFVFITVYFIIKY